MSSGLQISDQRTYQTNFCTHGSYALLGNYFERSWAGDNQVGDQPFDEHAYSLSITDVSTYPIAWKLHWSPYWQAYYGYDNPDPFRSGDLASCFGQSPSAMTLPAWTENDMLALINKLAGKVRGGDFNAGNFLGESRQTVSLVANTATRIAKALHYTRNGNFYKATRELNITRAHGHVLQRRYGGKRGGNIALNDVSDAWLEMQYGWLPLLSDVHSSMHSLAKRYETEWRVRYRARRRMERKEDYVSGYISWERKGERDVTLIVDIASPPSLSTQLQLNDPLSVAWEVLPWSFVVDWFLPIQSYLGALDFYRKFGVKQLIMCTKTVLTTESKGGRYPSNQFDPWVDIVGPADKGKWVTFVRSLESTQNYANMPLPQLKGMKEALSPLHLANAFALLNGSVNGFRSKLKF